MHTLPLKGTIIGVRRDASALEIDFIVEDAHGESVGNHSFSMGPKTTAASAAAAAQHAVDELAKSLHRRGHAAAEAATSDDTDQALVGRAFTGSVSQ